ncbi:MAG: hypothetical protein J7501_05200 [Bdellovibrio sp.]|nr:hypothetical protein [Bdellovibrio sp.]
MSLKIFKSLTVAMVTLMAVNSFAGGFLNKTSARTLSQQQAKDVAIVHARVLAANTDIAATIRTGVAPRYSVSYVSHLQYDGDSSGSFQVSVERKEAWQSCRMNLTIHDQTGELLQKSGSCR